jgi:hypothetical protein
MDISDTLAPKSDQMDYVDLIAGPKTLTITEVRRGPSPDQPVEIVFAEFDRPWRPAKTVRRVLVACWGPDSSVYPGRRVTVYGDASVKFGGQEVGGIRLSHASHIDGPVKVSLMISRGKSAPFTVQPLPTDTSDKVDDAVTAIGKATTPELLDKIERHAKQLGINGAEPVAAALKTKRAELEEES